MPWFHGLQLVHNLLLPRLFLILIIFEHQVELTLGQITKECPTARLHLLHMKCLVAEAIDIFRGEEVEACKHSQPWARAFQEVNNRATSTPVKCFLNHRRHRADRIPDRPAQPDFKVFTGAPEEAESLCLDDLGRSLDHPGYTHLSQLLLIQGQDFLHHLVSVDQDEQHFELGAISDPLSDLGLEFCPLHSQKVPLGEVEHVVEFFLLFLHLPPLFVLLGALISHFRRCLASHFGNNVLIFALCNITSHKIDLYVGFFALVPLHAKLFDQFILPCDRLLDINSIINTLLDKLLELITS